MNHDDLQMARQSLMEELQAISDYQSRIDSTDDESLKKVLAHNRDEEKEHAAILTDWIRAHDPDQDKLFKENDME